MIRIPSAHTLRLGLLLAAIVLLGGLLRTADLANRPFGLFRDEAEKGYNAWSLATTGGALDFSGGLGSAPPIQWHRLPWMINVMGGQTSALYQYAAAPFVRLGGLGVATTRLPSALVGTLAVLLAGLLAWRAWGAWAGLAAALALALSPWHLNFSRWALEGIFVPFFLLLTLAGLTGLERRRRWGAPLAGAALGWLFYAYSGAQPLVLAWGACLLALYARRLPWRSPALWIGLALFLIPVIPTALVRLAPAGSARLARVAIWSAPDATPLGVATLFFKNYFAHFDPRFLFLAGDLLPRHNVAAAGELLWPDLLFIPLGLWFIFKRRLPLRGALLTLLICAPIPAAITNEGIPHALRAFAMVVPLTLWAGFGLYVLSAAMLDFSHRLGARQLYTLGLVAMLAAGYCAAGGYYNFYRRYWTNAADDTAVQVAFEAGERLSWETVARQRQPGQRVFVNGYIPYAPYYQAFFMKSDPQTLARAGMEAGGFIYFNPEAVTPRDARPPAGPRRLAPPGRPRPDDRAPRRPPPALPRRPPPRQRSLGLGQAEVIPHVPPPPLFVLVLVCRNRNRNRLAPFSTFPAPFPPDVL